MEELKEFAGRKLDVTFDKGRLHNSIVLHMRLRGYSRELIGTDLLKGVTFNVICSPKMKILSAIKKAATSSKDGMGIDEAYEFISEALGIDEAFHRNSLDKIIATAVGELVEAINKEYCYEVAVNSLKEELPEKIEATIGWELIKNMLFRKLCNSESTWEEMKSYACRKVSEAINEEKISFEEEILNYVDSEEELQKNLKRILRKIYKSYPYTEK